MHGCVRGERQVEFNGHERETHKQLLEKDSESNLRKLSSDGRNIRSRDITHAKTHILNRLYLRTLVLKSEIIHDDCKEYIFGHEMKQLLESACSKVQESSELRIYAVPFMKARDETFAKRTATTEKRNTRPSTSQEHV
ncbi:hypothetical protein HJC23_013671 [Cyclotella cryptica]|uniref:Uncharacterized protein n=1 Tax=Cyclotella cryptica TaxID=29204 RepID=A0ABD3QV49_9STRA